MPLSVNRVREIIRKDYCPDFEYAYFDDYPWTPLKKRVSESRLALLTTGGVHLKTDKPFDVKNKLGDHSYRIIPNEIEIKDLMFSHPHFDTKKTMKDINCLFPLERMKEYLKEKKLGSLSPLHISFMGYTPIWEPLVKETIPEVTKLLKQHGVDLAFITYG